jgi:hypothetical protein
MDGERGRHTSVGRFLPGTRPLGWSDYRRSRPTTGIVRSVFSW